MNQFVDICSAPELLDSFISISLSVHRKSMHRIQIISTHTSSVREHQVPPLPLAQEVEGSDILPV